MENEIKYDCYTGWPSEVIRNIGITMSLFRLHYRRVKVGITNDPNRRFGQHRRNGWERMVVKYETTSIKHANEIEKYFINRNEWLENTWPGWSNCGEGCKFYVYILLADRIR